MTDARPPIAVEELDERRKLVSSSGNGRRRADWYLDLDAAYRAQTAELERLSEALALDIKTFEGCLKEEGDLSTEWRILIAMALQNARAELNERGEG